VVEALAEQAIPPEVAGAASNLGQEDKRARSLCASATFSPVRRRVAPSVIEGEEPDFVRNRA